jgi:hypothetical protein
MATQPVRLHPDDLETQGDAGMTSFAQQKINDEAPAPIANAARNSGVTAAATGDDFAAKDATTGGRVSNNNIAGAVDEGEPHQMLLNRAAINQRGLVTHEATHLWQNNLPPKLKEQIPEGSTDPKQEYNYGGVEGLNAHRAGGGTFLTLPAEQQSRLIENLVRRPHDAELQKAAAPYIEDIRNTPLSQIMPTAPQSSRTQLESFINQVRAKVPLAGAVPGLHKGDDTIETKPRTPLGPRDDIPGMEQLSGKPAPSSDTMAAAHPKGLVEPGNLPLANRPTIQNADGSHSSELSFSREEDGKEVLVPSVVNGKFMTPDGKIPPLGHKDATGKYIPTPQEKAMQDKAWAHYQQTGEHLGKFDNPDNADAYANVLHNRGEKKPEAFNPAKHFVQPGTGAKLSPDDAQKYLVKAKGNKDVARAMAKHDNHTF